MTARRLGILDWGVGGVGFYAALRERLPTLPVVYWSDAGTVPYGRQSRHELRTRVEAVARVLRAEHGVTHLAVACNAASAVVPLLPRDDAGLPVLAGVIEHGARAARAAAGARPARVGVVAGRGTVASRAYPRALPGLTVVQRVAQPISGRIEAGDLSSAELNADLDRIMRPLKAVDVLVLGCTHYPAVRHEFSRRAPAAHVVDPAAELLDWALREWELALHGDGAADTVLTTGAVAEMARAARLAFGFELPPPRHVHF